MTHGQVRVHFTSHFPVQPIPSPGVVRSLREEIRDALTDRDWQILEFIERVRIASVAQIAEVFFSHACNAESARKSAEQVIRRLVYSHVLHRVFRPAPKPGAPREVIGVGRIGASLLGQRRGDDLEPTWLRGPQDIGFALLGHDLGVTDRLLALRRSAAARPLEIAGRTFGCELDERFWWASRHIGVRLEIPEHLNEHDRFKPQRLRSIHPDAFAAITMFPLGDAAAQSIPPLVIPFVLENDSGRRKLTEATDQLHQYVWAARSRPMQQRFPQLDVPGYTVPLVFCTGYPGGTGRKRAQTLARRLAEITAKRRPTDRSALRPPILIVALAELEEKGLLAEAHDPWRLDEMTQLLPALVAASRPLINSGALTPTGPLDIDPAGAGTAGLRSAEADLRSQTATTKEAHAAAESRARRTAYERRAAEWETKQAQLLEGTADE